mmetsp:Transcript_24980/g.30213  ORF Transcript_24980/g.30213 Transcript_24980/m.30213 type:complete len:159 (+) Transcript_24980:184-660(+)|eukprot:CAMPEP_0197850146 /NCGR_PEP_ID=MMETSP1438-20131217/14401_1 /TAXON_ID=1461541 /ORGANISM="Pterosperma sp., Strain CCMP1384" /LENGTH=158 /DNA_ID=CAMNT_0043463139 /DNA_START=184 /DNA_END=660 /DNA_ORIENTATION=-
MRSPSKQSFPRVASKVEINNNVSWLNYPGIWTSYVTLTFISYVLFAGLIEPERAWTAVHLCHSVLTFGTFHWLKGAPFSEEQGKWDKITFWEQMDSGMQFTKNKKFFTAAPVCLFLLASHSTDYATPVLYYNFAALALCVFPKLPSMHKVRLLGINSD